MSLFQVCELVGNKDIQKLSTELSTNCKKFTDDISKKEVKSKEKCDLGK